MSELFVNPYINFSGHAREAMEFYHKALGGKLEFTAFDPSGGPKPAGPDDAIMHSRLESDGAIIMGTDGMEQNGSFAQAKIGENVSLAIGGSDEARLTKIFSDLSDGGKVTMPLNKESWGDTFGMFTDKYGIEWMVNISQSQDA